MKPVYLFIGVVVVVLLIAATALFVPQQTHSAFAAAVAFVQAAGKGDDAAASALLSPELRAYVAENCPEGSLAACVRAYTPAEWGEFLNAVFRRAQPDGQNAWDVLLLATYAQSQGFSGVCIYARSERVQGDDWHITRWAGWMSCDAPNAGLSALISDPSVPNRAP